MAKQKSGLQKEISSIFDDKTDLLNDPSKQAPPVRNTAKILAASRTPGRERQAKRSGATSTKNSSRLSGKIGLSDPRQRKTAILGAILAVIFVVVVGRAFVPGMEGPRKSEATTIAPPQENTVSAIGAVEVQWHRPEEFTGLLRDPMADLAHTRPEVKALPVKAIVRPRLTVTAILFSEDKPSTIINEQFVRRGDVVEGVTVSNIERRSVTFQMSGQEWQQRVHHDEPDVITTVK